VIFPQDTNLGGYNVAEMIFLLLSVLSLITVLQRIVAARTRLMNI